MDLPILEKTSSKRHTVREYQNPCNFVYLKQIEIIIEVNILEIIANIKHPKGDIRESFRSVIVFLPNSYSKFVEKLPSLIPLMIEGLADDKDECRKASMRSIKICIKKRVKSFIFA